MKIAWYLVQCAAVPLAASFLIRDVMRGNQRDAMIGAFVVAFWFAASVLKVEP